MTSGRELSSGSLMIIHISTTIQSVIPFRDQENTLANRLTVGTAIAAVLFVGASIGIGGAANAADSTSVASQPIAVVAPAATTGSTPASATTTAATAAPVTKDAVPSTPTTTPATAVAASTSTTSTTTAVSNAPSTTSAPAGPVATTPKAGANPPTQTGSTSNNGSGSNKGSASYPTSPPANGPAPEKCVTNPTFTHTYSGPDGTVVLTVSGGWPGEPLCTTKKIENQLFSIVTSNLFPQNYKNNVIVPVDKIGTYTDTNAPGKCEQDDVALVDSTNMTPPPLVLLNVGKPYELPFLSNSSRGPVTYYANSSYDCGTVVPPVLTSSANATLNTTGVCTFENGVSSEPVSITLASTGQTPISFGINGTTTVVAAGTSTNVDVTPATSEGETINVTATFGNSYSKVFTVTVPSFAGCGPVVADYVIPPAPTCATTNFSDEITPLPVGTGIQVAIVNGFVHISAAPGYVLPAGAVTVYPVPTFPKFTDCNTAPKSQTTPIDKYSMDCNGTVTDVHSVLTTPYLPNPDESGYVLSTMASTESAPVTILIAHPSAAFLAANKITAPTNCVKVTAAGNSTPVPPASSSLAFTGSNPVPALMAALSLLLFGALLFANDRFGWVRFPRLRRTEK